MPTNQSSNTAKSQSSSSSPLSPDQLRDVQDVLRRGPLTNRPILIPLGPKAFVPGKLVPPKQSRRSGTAPNDKANEEESEMVSVRISSSSSAANHDNDQRQEMTRRQAIEYLQTEIDQKLGKTTKAKKTESSGTRQKAISQPKQPPSSAAAAPSSPLLPMFEIREELNDAGHEVNAQAINVTKQLQEWEEQVRQAKGESKQGNESSLEEEKTENNNNNNVMEEDDDDDDEPEMDPETTTKPAVSDEEYDALAKRLEELARLEEMEEKKEQEIKTKQTHRASLTKKITAASDPSNNNNNNNNNTIPNNRKKKPSSGWVKGFLNSNKKKPAQKAPPKPPSPPTKDKEPSRPKVVGFAEQQNQVVEIPRVGQRSVQELQRPTPAQQLQSPLPQVPAQAQAQPLPAPKQDKLFAGVVQERRKPRRRNNRKATAATSQQSDHQHHDTNSTEEPPMSRFAQQRHGMD